MNKLLLKGRQKPHYQTSVDFVLVFLLFTLIKYLTSDLHIVLMFLGGFLTPSTSDEHKNAGKLPLNGRF